MASQETKVALFGAAGRMGTVITRCSAAMPDIRIVRAIESAGHQAIGSDLGSVAGISPLDVVVSDCCADAAGVDVFIDFSFHEAVPGHLDQAIASGIPIVIGTTGFTTDEKDAIASASGRIPIVAAPNMSLGVNLLFAVVEKAARTLGPDYRVRISETHHIHKKDAPSGTALRLGECVADGQGRDFVSNYIHNPADAVQDPGKIIINSIREGEVVGDHTVIFENRAERIEFTHNAWNRDSLAIGALRAAQWLPDRAPGLYSMQDVLGL